MRNITAGSVNEALFMGLYHLHHFGYEEDSRNGPVIISRTPVVTTYTSPARRVLINRQRDANPFFHLFESLWMLAGRRDLAFPQKFVSTFGRFSDDGNTLHGAYGYRWRRWFGHDQIDAAVDALKADRNTRRAVIAMWDGKVDPVRAAQGGKDVPCNTTLYFDTLGGRLNMTVCSRSNDVVLGAYGANAVHFSVLLEYVAAAADMEMGEYRQVSNNYHAYTELYPGLKLDKKGMAAFADSVASTDPYGTEVSNGVKHLNFDKPKIKPQPLMLPGERADWEADLSAFMDMVDKHSTGIGAKTAFFQGTADPMWKTWRAWKASEFETARQLSLRIVADDWRLAAQDWLAVREQRRVEKEQGA
jgi:hypothetical protein